VGGLCGVARDASLDVLVACSLARSVSHGARIASSRARGT